MSALSLDVPQSLRSGVRAIAITHQARLAARGLQWSHTLCVYCRGNDPFSVDDLGEPQQDQGWEVVAVNTSPALSSVGNAKIHFGESGEGLLAWNDNK